jgi:hypothetical protein
MTIEEIRSLHEKHWQDWDDEPACPSCGAAMHLASPELERRGLCGECLEKLVDAIPALLAELDARPPMVKFDMSPVKMTGIVVEWPIETYGAVTLCIDTGEAFSGWAEPSSIPGRGPVCLRACGESSWLTNDDARRLAAMLIAAANDVNAFDPGKRTA